jgi:hypothetical protein
MKNDSSHTLAGRVDRFNFNDPYNPYKIFWVEGTAGGRSGYAKGSEIAGKKIKIGDQIRLTGEWRVDPKYPRYGEQFFFSAYELQKEFKKVEK